ncbi:MAG: mechanosensitive ion channel family protein [Bryobacteraceae bacterium]|nr:mechanosensitive ion channel family protein [Bryobacteraceae bacterium]
MPRLIQIAALLAAISASILGAEPVRFEGRVLFEVRVARDGLLPDERARLLEQRIRKAADNPLLSPDRIAARRLPSGEVQIHAGQAEIGILTDADARAENRPLDEIAAERVRMIRSAVSLYREAWSWRSLARGAVFALLLTLAFAAAIWLVLRITSWMGRGTERWFAARGGVRVQKAEILSHTRVASLLSWAVLDLRILAIALLSFFYLPLLFGCFPFTQGWSAQIFTWIGDIAKTIVEAIAVTVPDLIFIAAIAAVTMAVLRAIKFLFLQVRVGNIRFRGFYPDWAVPTYKLVRLLVLALAIVAVFPYLPGSKSPAFQGISVFIGLLLSIGSSSAVANAVSGAILTYMRAMRVGDFVRIGDQEGDVVESSLLVTRIRTIKNVVVTIPNATLMNGHIINFSTLADNRGLILNTTVTIGYDAPWRTVHQLLIDAALATPGILAEPRPFVFQTALNDFNVAYQINAHTGNPSKMYEIYTDLHKNIQDKFAEGGVEIMSPNYFALRDGNTVTIPPGKRPADYQPPAFRVEQMQREKGAGA